MPRVPLVLVLSLIALTQGACARHTARAVRMPSSSSVSAAQKPSPGSDSPNKVGDAIRSLKKQRATSDKAEGRTEGTPGAVVPHSSAPGDPKQVGTGGALSVETRSPSPQAGVSSEGSGSPPRGHLRNRAGQAFLHAGGGTWAGVAALCLLAVLVVALTMRRSRTTT